MAAISPINLAMAVGTGGAFVDVTSYLTGSKTIEATWGQTDPFRDVQPGTFTFTLDNFDGRFTPGNVLSPLATPIQEGTAVCWQAGTRLMSGTILNFAFPNSADERGRITITCDDVLGDLGRYQMPDTGFMSQLEASATPLLMWPMNDASDATGAVETTGNGLQLTQNGGQLRYSGTTEYFVQQPTFGTSFAGFLGQTAMNLTYSNVRNGAPYFGDWGSMIADLTGTTNFSYTSGNGGYWGFWCDQVWADDKDPAYQSCVSVSINTLNFQNTSQYPLVIGGGVAIPIPYMPLDAITVNVFPSSVTLSAGGANLNAVTASLTSGPHYYAVGITGTLVSSSWQVTATLYVDGVSQGSAVWSGLTSATWNPQPLTAMVNVFGQAAGTFARLGHFSTLPHPEIANAKTMTDKLTFYDNVIPALPATAVSGTLATSPIGQTVQTGTGLEALQAMMRTEQGYLYPVTTGTLTSPTVTLTMRSRTRALTPKVSFDAVTEIEGVLPFERHITNLVATATATGDGTSATYSDSSVSSRASNASSTDDVLLSQYADARLWASDRINRAKVLTPYPTTITIDSQTTPTDRSADLLGLVAGDRISITNIDSKITGFSSWDGWLIGATETHTPFSDMWTLYLAPVTDQGVYDTSVFQPDADILLVSAVNSSTTSIVIPLAASTLSKSTDLPVTVLVDGEQMTVTNVTISAFNVTLTVTRGANGTTAASHSASAVLSVLPNSVYAF